MFRHEIIKKHTDIRFSSGNIIDLEPIHTIMDEYTEQECKAFHKFSRDYQAIHIAGALLMGRLFTEDELWKAYIKFQQQQQ